MKFPAFIGIKDIKELLSKKYNQDLIDIRNWWNDHDSGVRAWTVFTLASFSSGSTSTPSIIVASGRSTAQTAGVASIATVTIGTVDSSYLVSANLNVTSSTAFSINIQVAYTDETNTAQTLTLNSQSLAGALLTAITNVQGAGPYEGIPVHIRAKAGTTITIKTTGTFTTVTYNVEGVITQIR